MRAPTHPTTRPRPSNSLLRRRQRRATANLLVRGVGPAAYIPRCDAGRAYQKISYNGRATFTRAGRTFLPGHGFQLTPLRALAGPGAAFDNTPTSRGLAWRRRPRSA